MKLHLGCGRNYLDGWINTDIDSKRYKLDQRLDITENFPFENNTISYIFSEHVIEHISYKDGKFMLEECYRIMKPNGKIRISTPDLKFLIEFYTKDKSQLQKDYVNLSISHSAYDIDIYLCTDAFIINNFVRAWGHLFIYDEETLTNLFTEIGFKNINSYKICESEDKNLQNLEDEKIFEIAKIIPCCKNICFYACLLHRQRKNCMSKKKSVKLQML